ncbi:hypothetical protein ACJEIK_26310 [Mycobacterium sp. SMC-16]|uniref:hypothetical protein n=1 Tax=Mycobacterium sp. SMC-16 TaxID=3385967 RepID=UPI00390C7CDB
MSGSVGNGGDGGNAGGAGDGNGTGGAGNSATDDQNNQVDGDGKSTETVEFWRDKAREQEKRAKSNAAAAKELEQLKESQKTDAQKAADRLAAAEAEAATVPAKTSEALKAHLIDLHKIDAEDAELFLTATDPDLLLKQVDRLLARSGKRPDKRHIVSNEGKGTTTNQAGNSNMREFTRNLFGNNE